MGLCICPCHAADRQLAYAAQRLRQAGRRDIRRAAAVGFDRLPLGAARLRFFGCVRKTKNVPPFVINVP